MKDLKLFFETVNDNTNFLLFLYVALFVGIIIPLLTNPSNITIKAVILTSLCALALTLIILFVIFLAIKPNE